MANVLKMANIQSILSLHASGWKQSRIAAELGVDRETVRKYLRQQSCGAKPANAPTGSDGPKPAEFAGLPAPGPKPAENARGRSTILGHDSRDLPPPVRARIGYMAEGHPVYPWMRVAQYAAFQQGFYPHWNQQTFAAVIDYFAIDLRIKAGHLSHGQRAGLHLATTLAIEPELLVLDDPATGLDPAARRSLLEAMIYFTRNQERTIFFSTHLLDDVERVADHVAILDYSVLRASCTVETFRERVRLITARFPDQPPAELPEIPGLLRATRGGNDLNLIVANHIGRAEHVLESAGAESVDDLPLSLEDALTAYVGRQGKKSLFNSVGEMP